MKARRVKTYKRGLKKRWYVDAQIPKGMPFIGGSSFKAGSGTLTKRSLNAYIKSQAEVKQKIVVNGSTPNVLQNTIYTFNPLGNIGIGTGANARIGSGIFIKSWNITLTFSLTGAPVTDSSHFRVMIVKLDQEYLSGLDTLAAGVGSTDLFVQGSSNLIHSHLDNHKVKVHMDSLVLCNGQSQKSTQIMRYTALKDITFKYATPTSNYSNFGNYYLVVIPNIVGGVTGTTIVGGVQWESVVNFTDA